MPASSSSPASPTLEVGPSHVLEPQHRASKFILFIYLFFFKKIPQPLSGPKGPGISSPSRAGAGARVSSFVCLS